ALEQWAKVLEWTDGASEKEPRQARLASSSESAVVYQELGDARTAERLLKQAVELAEDLVAAPSDSAPEKRVGDRLALAGVHVNLAGLYVTSREPEPGLTHADRALEVLTKVGEHPARGMLAFAGTLQRGTAHLLLGGFSEAQTSLREATDQGTELMTAGQTHILPQLVECAGRLFAAAKAQKSPQDALASIEQVARIATATFEAQGAPALQIFVNAQMH